MANLKKSKTSVNVGVDIGKFYLDVHIHEKGIYFQEANSPDGIRNIMNRLSRYSVERVVMEASGRYEYLIAEACFNKSLPVVIAKPVSVRRYAGAIDQLAKTDKIDAAVIAEYGAVIKPKPTPQKSKNLLIIKDLLTRRRQLINMKTQEKNRMKLIGNAFDVSCKRIIKVLEKEISRMETRLQKHVDEQADWAEKQAILLSAPGVGNTLVYSILADLPEIGTLTNRQISKLVGVAPINRESGRMRGKRRIIGGRANIRTTLYMATLSATLCNPAIKSFYRNLKENGKHSKVAITACMRKFITYLNAMVRDKQMWCLN